MMRGLNMKPLVSIYCLAYNHEKYIRSALDGFVSQQTTFPYEVYVHDDASTDNTASIIKEYAEKYPDVIKPIFQKENQYSKKIPIVKTFIAPQLQGKYVACCEGDDYWCDSNKLQKQVDWLETHPDYSLCVHNTVYKNMRNGNEKRFNNNNVDMDIPIEDILQGGGACFHTSSFMYRIEYLELPKEFMGLPIGDYPRAVYLAICGKVRYLHDVMSVYRAYIDGSYTVRSEKESKSIHQEKKKKIIKMLYDVNRMTNEKYSECITRLIHYKEFELLLENCDLKEIKKNYKDIYTKLQFDAKIKLYIKYIFPFLR